MSQNLKFSLHLCESLKHFKKKKLKKKTQIISTNENHNSNWQLKMFTALFFVALGLQFAASLGMSYVLETGPFRLVRRPQDAFSSGPTLPLYLLTV